MTLSPMLHPGSNKKGLVMTTAGMLFLAGVLIAFGAFALALAYYSRGS